MQQDLNIVYSNFENLVLWASSEKIGCAVNESHGVSAFVTPRRDFGGTGWNTGVLEYWDWWNEIFFNRAGKD